MDYKQHLDIIFLRTIPTAKSNRYETISQFWLVIDERW